MHTPQPPPHHHPPRPPPPLLPPPPPPLLHPHNARTRKGSVHSPRGKFPLSATFAWTKTPRFVCCLVTRKEEGERGAEPNKRRRLGRARARASWFAPGACRAVRNVCCRLLSLASTFLLLLRQSSPGCFPSIVPFRVSPANFSVRSSSLPFLPFHNLLPPPTRASTGAVKPPR